MSIFHWYKNMYTLILYRYHGTKEYESAHYKSDGLTSLNYSILKREELSLCTWIKINIGKINFYLNYHFSILDCGLII